MNYKTADQIGQDAVFNITQSKALTRRIFALLSCGVQLSEGAIELLAPDSYVRDVLESLLMGAELKQIGARLTQEKFKQLLLAVIQEKFKRKLKSRGLSSTSSFDDTVRELGLNLDLTIEGNFTENTQTEVMPEGDDGVIDVQFEDAEDLVDFIVIALRDEVDASKGALMVVKQQQNVLAMRGAPNIFSLPQVAEKLQEGLMDEALKWGRVLFTLPMISVPDEFEEKIRSLSPAMHAPNMQAQFIAQSTMGFANRPVRSRKVIAEVLREHLNARLMDNIIFLCDSSQPDKLQIEAVNHLVGYLGRLQNAAEIMLTAITLIKVMEESGRAAVRSYVFEKLAENVTLIRNKLPTFLQDGRVIPTLKTILVTDPETYKESVRRFVFSFAKDQPEPNPVVSALREDLDLTTDPTVITIYLGLLQELESDAAAKQAIEKQRWTLYFGHRTTNPNLAEEFLTEFRRTAPLSLTTPIACFPLWSEEQRLHFIQLTDDLAMVSAAEKKNTATVKKIASFFQQAIKNCSPPILLAIVSTKTTMSSNFEAHYNEQFWTSIGKHLAELVEDKTFVENFVNAGHVHLLDFAAQIVGTTETEYKKQLLALAKRKIAAINPDCASLRKQEAGGQEAISLTLTEMAMLIEEAKRISEAEGLFHSYIETMRSPLLDQELFRKHLLELATAVRKKEKLQPLLIHALSDFARSHLQSRELAEFLRDIFLQAFNDNIPNKSKNTDEFSPVSAICADALDGLVTLYLSGRLLAGHNKALIRVLKRQINERPLVMSLFKMVEGVKYPPHEVFDPFKDSLKAALKQIDPEEDKDLI